MDDPSRVVTIAAQTRAPETGMTALGFGPGQDPGTELRDAARARLASQAGRGELTVPIAAIYPLDDVVAAHKQLIDGHAAGKINKKVNSADGASRLPIVVRAYSLRHTWTLSCTQLRELIVLESDCGTSHCA